MPRLTVIHGDRIDKIDIEVGENLRQVLLKNEHSPYTRLTRVVNCGGRGLCATCGVWVVENEPQPEHWHDKLASKFAYPRLSCQITIADDITIQILDDKIVWGGRKNRA